MYAQWNKKTFALKSLKKEVDEITFDEVIPFLEGKRHSNPNVLRLINDNPHISIRKGKYGQYIFYKTNEMKKPRFLKLQEFNDNVLTCDKELICSWIKETYNVYV